MHKFTLSFFLVLIVLATPTSMAECPRLCECKWKSGKESVVCTAANFTSIPGNLDSGTQILDLTDNTITTVRNHEFMKAGLMNLQKIYLTKCRLKSIEKWAFKDLINLVELDLSNNLLTSIPAVSFEAISELRELRLNGNPIREIFRNSFVAVPQLVRLEMSGCNVSFIETDSFLGLNDSLEWLKLDNNKLNEVNAAAFTILQNLHGMELAGNPWNCSCKLRELREWMLKQNVPYDIPPVCYNPRRLQGKSWKLLDLDEFACPPKIYPGEMRAQGVEGKNVTISCKIAGIPTPNVKWLLRNRLITNLSGSPSSQKKLYVVSQKSNSSELTINSAEIQDAGSYMCAAENKAGRAEAVVTLTVTKDTSNHKFSTKILLVSVLLGVTLTFFCCLLTACFVSVRKKRLLKWHTSECRREDNYEKIEMKPKVCHRNLNGGVNREESVAVGKKNGDYRVVPATDTENENEEEEESTLEGTTPGTSSMEKAGEGLSKNNGLNDTYSISQTSRDTISRTCNLTSGTYKYDPFESALTTATPSWKPPTGLTTIYTTASCIREVPDVIGHSSYGPCVSSRTQSENGSASDINELFCTLPRKSRYRSNDSQTALLPESRCGSDSSADSFARRLSVEMQRYPAGRAKTAKPSGSLLNLARDSATPLLDVRGLENRLQKSPAGVNPYDYRAAQLEKFLEEYRVLQKELTKMKQTCDSICQEQLRENVSPCTTSGGASSANLNNQVNSPNSNSIQDSIDFKNFENELTKYLMSRSPSTAKNFPSAALHN
ncbi:uncharacterized protein kek3 [Euwallacea fornicatus]|uniref:uncharacterized protein kek3 n=1 Tax=Euwallacea fornicatus TaxID=995702 RepID=UPI00338F4E10